MKLELSFSQDEIKTHKIRDGTQIREQILQGKKSSIKSIIKDIKNKKNVTINEIPSVVKYRDLVISGKADSIIFVNQKPIISEVKTSSYNFTKISESHDAQSTIYAFLLEQMGFDCSSLKLAIIKIKNTPEMMNSENLKTINREKNI